MCPQDPAIAKNVLWIKSVLESPGNVESNFIHPVEKRLLFDPADTMFGADRSTVTVYHIEDNRLCLVK